MKNSLPNPVAIRRVVSPVPRTLTVLNVMLAFIAFGALARAAAAAEMIDTSGYVHDGEHRLIHSGSGGCVRTGFWTPALAIPECDPQLVKKVASVLPVPPKPAARPPAPATAQAAPAPVKPIFVKTTLSAEDLFGFDRYELMPAAATQLDQIAESIKRSPELDSIQISGYADRIGSSSYNLALSRLRADAVKTYLVSRGIDEGRIKSVGMGTVDPIAACTEISGPVDKSNERLVACLQPNRRVEVQAFVEQLARH